MAYFDYIKDEIRKEAKKKWNYDLPERKIEEKKEENKETGVKFEYLRQKAIEAREELHRIKEKSDEEFIPKGEVKENPIIDLRSDEERRKEIMEDKFTSITPVVEEKKESDMEDVKSKILSGLDIKSNFMEKEMPLLESKVKVEGKEEDNAIKEIVSILKDIRNQNDEIIDLLRKVLDLRSGF